LTHNHSPLGAVGTTILTASLTPAAEEMIPIVLQPKLKGLSLPTVSKRGHCEYPSVDTVNVAITTPALSMLGHRESEGLSLLRQQGLTFFYCSSQRPHLDHVDIHLNISWMTPN